MAALPDDCAVTAIVDQARRARGTISKVEPYRAQVERWFAASVESSWTQRYVVSRHGGSYSALSRILTDIRAGLPPDVTVPVLFASADVARSISVMGLDFLTPPSVHLQLLQRAPRFACVQLRG